MLDFSALPDVRGIHPELTEPGELEFAAHMLARERALHAVFGDPDHSGNILVPNDTNLTVNWPGGGIYKYAPSDLLDSWHYVTSGLAHPFPGPDHTDLAEEERFSGFGCELVLSTPDEVNWPFEVLLNLVKYLLFGKNSRPIYSGDRIPCGGPLVLDMPTQLNHLVARFSRIYESQIKLPGGRCELVHLVGATQPEIDLAKSEGQGSLGSMILCGVMDRLGVGSVSDPGRECLTQHKDFNSTWQHVKEEIDGAN